MVEVSKNQVCLTCGSSDLRICYFKHELDPKKHMISLTFSKEFKEGWKETYQCTKCLNIPVKMNIFT